LSRKRRVGRREYLSESNVALSSFWIWWALRKETSSRTNKRSD
jgi:hypothetical protein